MLSRNLIYRSGVVLATLLFGMFYTIAKPLKYGLDLKGGVSILLEATPIEGELNSSSMDKLAEVMDRRINSIGIAEPVIQVAGNNKLLVEIPDVKSSEEAIDLLGKTALLEFRLYDEDGMLGDAVLTGRDLVKAEVAYNAGVPAVSITFSKSGASKFYEITRDNIGEKLAITLDGEIQSDPVINGAISNGQAAISGSFSYEEARKLSLLLSAGSLPAKVDVVEVRIVSATLGEEALANSMNAGFWALIFILVFMTFWYLIPGLIASLSLGIFTFLSLGVMNFLGATLTLPGIAGFILSLGMAVDANVIIFEMIKEELTKGLTIMNAIKHGFNKSLTSIIDSNVTTLIITTILFSLGTGSVKGYSITLSIGVLASMFSAIFVTKVMLELIFSIFKFRSFGIINIKPNFNIISRSKLIFSISIFSILASSYCLYTKGLNYGVDFTGGNIIAMKFEELDKQKFQNSVNEFDNSFQVQFSDENNIAIVKSRELSSNEKGDFYSHIRQTYSQFDVDREESIGAVVGNSLKRNAILALILGAILIIIYISLRFRFLFAISAIIALIHDVIISVGAVSYLGYEVNSTFIVAILTILGYSINDTVVVFDRIRDNLKKNSLSESINKSINQVFIRSFNTSLTTLLSLLALIFYSVDSLKPFLITFLFGIVAGTYSSIFLASPLVYLMSKKD